MVNISGSITVDGSSISVKDDGLLVTVNGIKEETVYEVFGIYSDKDYTNSDISVVPDRTFFNVTVIYPNCTKSFIGQVVSVADYQITHDGKIVAFKITLREVSGTSSQSLPNVPVIKPFINDIIVAGDAMALYFAGDAEVLSDDNAAYIRDHYGVVEHMGKMYHYQTAFSFKVRYNMGDGNGVKYIPVGVIGIYHTKKLGVNRDIERLKLIISIRYQH